MHFPRAFTILASLTFVVSAGGMQMVEGETRRSWTGYTDRGLDPDDRPIDPSSCCQQDPDIRSTMRKVWEDDAGQRWLTIKFRAYEPFSGYWTVTARLDARAGGAYDYRVTIWDDGLGQAGCYLRPGHRVGKYHAPRWEDHMRCRVPLRWIHRTKHVRWQLRSPKGLEGTGVRVIERAPDHGWYPEG